MVVFYQACLIRLIDELNIKDCPCSQNKQCHATHLEPLIESLTESLIFINEQYKDFFDLESNLPRTCEDYHRANIQKRIKEILQNLIQISISDRLLHVMLHPLMDFVQQKKAAYSFNDKRFLYQWLQHLENNWMFVFDANDSSVEFCKQLIEWNLNSLETIDFFIDFITEKYQLEDTKEDQLQVLRYFQKCFKQHVVVNKTGYQINKPSLKETLINWVVQEIIYIESTCHINDRNELITQPDDSTEKVKTNLSVAQLGCFIRLCIDSGIFPEKKKKQLITVFAENFSTTNRDNLSYGSLKNHQYHPENSAVDKLKSIVFKQLKLLQENNF
ncbi:hypothetical protein J1N10_17915 [Carboxylicivirga sp. A043]|uniref:hypothetical protein n=1 Tax=Carboxylicivirga litoralis TaxID=2816963 RepID=UPI0021CB452E|nr:hypothetical protein [Carboxylicivirga sp. A043]MCU4157855.1 hypothetical protein [Carboxylicivirga sp. A043]